jgi:hypothetical protein
MFKIDPFDAVLNLLKELPFVNWLTWLTRTWRRWLVFFGVGLLSGLLGAGVVQLGGQQVLAQTPPPAPNPAMIGTVDPVPRHLQAAEQAYLKRCGSCHVALPPQSLPTETWQVLITDPQHYGTVLPRLPVADQNLIVKYLQAYTYSLNPGETTPFRVGRSRYFRVLHPQVDLPKPVTLEGCVTCHPGAKQFDYRRLNPGI